MWIVPLILGALALGFCAFLVNAEVREWWDAKLRVARERQRSMDLQMLWPVCVDLSPDMTRARMAFAVHAFQDPAWTTDFSDEQLYQIIEALGAPGSLPEWHLLCPNCGTRDSIMAAEAPRKLECSGGCGAFMELNLPLLP
jgi:hypothetical protein